MFANRIFTAAGLSAFLSVSAFCQSSHGQGSSHYPQTSRAQGQASSPWGSSRGQSAQQYRSLGATTRSLPTLTRQQTYVQSQGQHWTGIGHSVPNSVWQSSQREVHVSRQAGNHSNDGWRNSQQSQNTPWGRTGTSGNWSQGSGGSYQENGNSPWTNQGSNSYNRYGSSHGNYRGGNGWGQGYNQGWNQNNNYGYTHQGNVHRYWGNHDRWREGYRHSGGSSFFFGFYLGSPYSEPCVVSPWYYYSALPGYLPYNRVIVVDNAWCNWNSGYSYPYYAYRDTYSYGDGALNSSLDMLSGLYQNHDLDAIYVLVPQNSRVAVYQDGRYMYSLAGQDFRQMLHDNVNDIDTRSFEITSVRRDGGLAIVTARHTFLNPDGGEETVFQKYRFQRLGGRYVVTDFETTRRAYDNF